MDLSSLPMPWRGHGHPSLIRGSLSGTRVLAPVRDGREFRGHGRVAKAVADRRDGELFFVSPAIDGDAVSVDSADDLDAIENDVFTTERSMTLDAREFARRTESLVNTHDIDTLVLGASHAEWVRRSPVERLAGRVSCDVVIHNGRPMPDTVSSVLLAFAGGPHSGVATDVAGDVAAAFDAWVDVLHVVEPSAGPDDLARADASLDAALARLAHHDDSDRWRLEAEDTTEALIEQSQYYDLLVLGMPTKSRLRQLIFGSTVRAVRNDGHSAVLVVQNGEA